jgi:predicted DNA-binding protein YlxM (UPF0122 family)
MAKLTIAEAAQHFNVSKEAIHNRIRRGTMDCVIEHGVKYVVTGEENASKPQADSKYYDYIEQENERLRTRVGELEGETRSLREQREQMLIEERLKIEQIYKERDEQLRSVLQVVASKFLSATAMEHAIEEAVTAEVIEPQAPEPEREHWVALKEFLKLKGCKEKARAKIKARFKKRAKRDPRILLKKGKVHLDPSRYDYSDLLAL